MSRIYTSDRDRTAPKVPTQHIRDQGPALDLTGVKVSYGPAPKPAKVPALFSAKPVGVDPMTGEGWK